MQSFPLVLLSSKDFTHISVPVCLAGFHAKRAVNIIIGLLGQRMKFNMANENRKALIKDPNRLTARQEEFAQCIAKGMSQYDALHQAYNCAPNAKRSSLDCRASELRANRKISVRIDELRAPVVEEVRITLKTHLEDLLRLRNLAADSAKYGPAIAAEIARGKASGLHVDKTELTGKDGKDLTQVAIFQLPANDR
jgi:phage terminase small subunit